MHQKMLIETSRHKSPLLCKFCFLTWFPDDVASVTVCVSGSESAGKRINMLLVGNWGVNGLRDLCTKLLTLDRLSTCMTVCPRPRGSVPVKAERCSHTAWAQQPTQNYLTAHIGINTHTQERKWCINCVGSVGCWGLSLSPLQGWK